MALAMSVAAFSTRLCGSESGSALALHAATNCAVMQYVSDHETMHRSDVNYVVPVDEATILLAAMSASSWIWP